MIDSEIEIRNLAEALNNTHKKRSLIRTSYVCHRRCAAGRNQQVEEYKHTHTHLFSKYFKPYRLSGILNKNSDLGDIIKVRVFYKTNP